MPHKDPIKRRAYQRVYQEEWRKKNRQKWRGILDRSDKKRVGTPKRIVQTAEVRYRRHHREKTLALEKYGKKCVYCGCETYEVLCIDHINDDGKSHRASAEYMRYSGMWPYVLKTPYRPDLYQILCHNCNMAKQHYKIKPNGNEYKPFEYWKKLSERRNKKSPNVGM